MLTHDAEAAAAFAAFPRSELGLSLHLCAASPVCSEYSFSMTQSLPHKLYLAVLRKFLTSSVPLGHDESSITNNPQVSFGLWP
jgi:hypothetical protein